MPFPDQCLLREDEPLYIPKPETTGEISPEELRRLLDECRSSSDTLSGEENVSDA